MSFSTICRRPVFMVSARVSTQLLKVMKLTILFLIVVCLHVSAAGYGQKGTITISGKDLPLEKVFSVIKKQTDYVCFYGYEVLKDAKPVSLSFKEADVQEVLKAALWGQGLDFSITGKTITIMKKPGETPAATGLSRMIKANGVVYNEAGQPLSGANVTVKETGRGTITNAKGEFVLSAPEISTLIVSFTGYATEEIKATEEKTVQVFMKIAKNELDKVVVQGYGSTTQRLATGSIVTVTAAQIERQPVMNALASLEGQVPGVVVTQNNGYASSPFKVEIRGRSVIDNGQPSDPLYIIDGVPLTVLNLTGANYATGSTGFAQVPGLPGPAGGQSPFFSINPQDIENITVLKDADATAIYGSRGANGVIIINTKSGKAGKTKLDISIDQGESEVTGRYKLLNTQQYLMMRREAFKNDGITPNAGNAYDLLIWDTTRNTNWQNAWWGGIGHETDAQLSLSGGDKQNTFRVGGSYHNQAGVLIHSGADKRGTVQFNYSHKSLDQRLELSLTSTYGYTSSNLISVAGSGLEAPNAPSIFTPNGALNWSGWQPVPDNLVGGALLKPYSDATGFLNSHLKIQYELAKGLVFSAQLGYNTMHNSQYFMNPIASQNPTHNPVGSANFGNSNSKSTIVEPNLEYSRIINKFKLNFLVGGSAHTVNMDVVEAQGTGFINDHLLGSVSNAPIKYGNDGFGEYKYAAVFGRVNANWENKYILNLSGRRDGSSRFGPGKQYGNFGAIGLAWIFTEESWFKNHLAILSFGKIRSSYGITGNDQIGDYGFLTQWSASQIIPYQGRTSYNPLHHANPNLQWESNKKLEIAGNLGFFKDRLTMELAWYQNRSGNQLVYEGLPIITGFTSVMTNLNATIQNSGWEMTLRGKIIDKKYFTWSMNFNIGANRNKLIAFPGLDQSPYAAIYSIGQSLSIIRLLHYTGVDPQTGQYTYQDKNHNGTIDYDPNIANNDLHNVDLAVKYEGGIATELVYKGVQLNIFANFRKSQAFNGLFRSPAGLLEQNNAVVVLNRWQKPGDQAKFARFTTQPQPSDNFYYASDVAYVDATFLRIRNISLSYTIPQNWINGSGLQNFMVYIRVQNPFVFTKYPGLDPEITNLGTMPLEKVIVGGIKIIF